jgi:hypothetical protein
MRALIFNLLADLARDAGCEEDAWTVALAVSQEMTNELALEGEDHDLSPGLIAEVSLQGAADFTFKWLLRSAPPFCDDEWADVLDEAPIGVRDEPESLFPESLLTFDLAGRRGTNRE